ncbi:hypothetical protein AGMMS49574_24930 [Bacteroidia bacterium]|nr:hypothetical protein AGMMS49574_24930 [Bacteroidia bacterium]
MVVVLESIHAVGFRGIETEVVSLSLPGIAHGETCIDSIYIEGRNTLRDGRARFELVLSEANGHTSRPAETSFLTLQAAKPNIDVSNLAIDYISDKEMRLRVNVKNTGSVNMKDVRINVGHPKSVYAKGDAIKALPLLKPNEEMELDFTFVQNQYFDPKVADIFNVTPEDANGKPVGEQMRAVRGGLAATTETAGRGRNAVATVIAPATFSDVDRNIPVSTKEYESAHTYALVIGNEKYAANQEVPFAQRDADVFTAYCVRTFKIPRSNITHILNATGNQMKTGIRDLARKAAFDQSGQAELIIYYSGHGIIAKDKFGISDEEYDQYLIPVDASGADASQSISRKEIYAALSNVPFKRASIFLDACNIKGDKGITKVAKNDWKGNVFVFASSAPNETSGVYNDKSHGMFTYFLLKSIQDKKGNINYENLVKTVEEGVKRESSRFAGKSQNPQIEASPQADKDWRRWKIAE